jgi:hypothetical protein
MRFDHRRFRCLALLLLTLPLAGLQAQTGFVHFRTRLSGDIPNQDRGVTHAFLQQPSGPAQEVFTFEFAPGSYTMTRIETIIGPCRASTTDVAFTITAGQWTIVSVPVSYDACFYQAEPITSEGGEGMIEGMSAGSPLEQVTCVLNRTGPAGWAYLNYEACRGAAPFGSAIFVHRQATAGSFLQNGDTEDTFTVVADTTGVVATSLRQLFTGPEPDDSAYTSQVADLSVVRTASTVQGMLMRSTFHVVNNGPGDALRITTGFNSAGNLQEGGGSARYDLEPSLGNCNTGTNQCIVPDLPAGKSVDYTLRITGFPNATSDPLFTPYCLVFGVATSSLDPDPSNNSVACTGGSVQVTVTTGSATPGPATVAKGTADVPMLQFHLAPAAPFTLGDITLSASGTGNEQVDVTAVKLYVDVNGDGRVDGGDNLLASGSYAGNDGTVTLPVTPGYTVSGPTDFLVTYDFNVSLAQGLGAPLLLLGMVSLAGAAGGRSRRRHRWSVVGLGLLLVLAVSRCGGDSSGPGSAADPTFRATLTGLSADGSAVPGVSLAGAVITVTR